MPIQSVFYRWKKENVKKLKEKPGFYIFYNSFFNPIFIGESSNLKKCFLNFWNCNNNLKWIDEIYCYKREYTSKPSDRKKELLKEFQEKNGEILKYNDKK